MTKWWRLWWHYFRCGGEELLLHASVIHCAKCDVVLGCLHKNAIPRRETSMNEKTTRQYHPQSNRILIKVLRVQDGTILGLGEVVEDAGLTPYSAGTKVLYRGGMAVSEDPLFRILAGSEIVATVEGT